ncbi:MAG: M81 family metallopeptidase [Chloroflexota bacterium]|nr:M81 family metallopeptidase [Chloroflexota bacterium]
MSRYRIVAAAIEHETNVFSPISTDLEAFRRSGLKFGRAIEAERGTNSSMGGFFSAADRHGAELIPVVSVWSTPSGTVTREAIMATVDPLLEALRQEQPDAVALSLHGALVSEIDRDTDGWILAQVRETVGWDVPVVCELDLHGNISQRMVEEADILVGYDTYPHVDMAERGEEVIDLLVRMLDGEINPAMAMVKPPMLPTSQRMMTSHPPMSEVLGHAHEIERRPGVVNATVSCGFPPADVEEAGVSIVVTTDGDFTLAVQYAEEHAGTIWALRDGFLGGVQSFGDAAGRIASLPERPEKPLLIVDIADSIWSGSAGDSVELVRFFLDQVVREAAVAPVVDPEVVQQAIAAGVGVTIEASLGAKFDTLHGDPLPCRARVLQVGDGHYVNAGPMKTGLPVNTGPTVTLGIGDPEVRVVVTTYPDAPIEPAVFTTNGIDLASTRVLGLKGKGHFRSGFAPAVSDIVLVEGPGITGSQLERLPLRYTPRPIWPLDDISWP